MFYRFNDLIYRLNDIISRLNETFFCFDFRSNFLVSISFLINIGKEMSLPGFRTKLCFVFVLWKKEIVFSIYFKVQTHFKTR